MLWCGIRAATPLGPKSEISDVGRAGSGLWMLWEQRNLIARSGR